MFKRLAYLVVFILVVSYIVGTAFYRHSHVINGKIIVHSHFYHERNSSGRPLHQHTLEELLLIFYLEKFYFTGLLFLFIYANYYLAQKIFIVHILYLSKLSDTFLATRAPPFKIS